MKQSYALNIRMISATSGSIDTKTKILNAAEKLFGMNGFDGTSLRDITAEAQVNLAAVNYHFQSKESLIDALIERRIEPINRSRFEMLDAAGPTPSVEKIVEAFLLPLLMVEVKAAAPMLGRVLSNPDQFVERVYKKHLFPVVERFLEAISQALPNLPAEERFWRLQFMAGTMTHLLALSGVMPLMSGQPFDRTAVMGRLVPFLAAGLRAPVAVQSTKREEL
jgi:AcrR family transcriptional regulator